MARSPRRNPDHRLWAGNAHDLNQRYYRTSSAVDYLRQRMTNLIAVAAKPAALELNTDETLTLGRLTIGPSEPSDAELERKARERFIVTEAETLLHHVTETLLRLYFAHEDDAACPWLEIARLRDFGKFKTMVRNKVVSPTNTVKRQQSLAEVFFGTSDPSRLEPSIDNETWEKATKSLDEFVVHLATYYLNNAHLYNATKHGLAVDPGENRFELGSQGEDPLISKSGPSIRYLEVETDREGNKRWQVTTKWVSVDVSLALAHIACKLMEGLWSVARMKYLHESGARIPVDLLSRITLEAVLRPESEKSNPIEIDRWSMHLVYEDDPVT